MPAGLKPHFEMFAAYNGWANDRLYDAASQLDDDAWSRDVGAFFASLCGTLNHILVTDRIWMKRFTGTGDSPTRLDATLHADFAGLQAARKREDGRIAEWVAGLEEAALDEDFTYVTATDGREITQPLGPALAHLFNHQTHHRGQAHGIMSTLGAAPPSLDLIYFQRERRDR